MYIFDYTNKTRKILFFFKLANKKEMETNDNVSFYQKICNTLSRILSREVKNHHISEIHEDLIITYEIKQHMNDKLKKLPKYQIVKMDDMNEKCIICCENYNPNPREYKRLLPCNHHFHKKCIDKWLLDYKPLCPLCLTDYSNILDL